MFIELEKVSYGGKVVSSNYVYLSVNWAISLYARLSYFRKVPKDKFESGTGPFKVLPKKISFITVILLLSFESFDARDIVLMNLFSFSLDLLLDTVIS